jgi:hypothetical protein
MSEKPGFSFSLRSLIGFVTVAAGGCAALVYASPWIARGVCLLTITLLMFSVIMAVEGKSYGRVYWRGFAICGWAYFLITIATPQHQVWTLPVLETLDDLSHRMPGVSTVDPSSLRGDELNAWRMERQRFRNSFIQIGHASFLLIFAFLGGFAAQLLRLRSDRTNDGPPATQP